MAQKFVVEAYSAAGLEPRVFQQWDSAIDWAGTELAHGDFRIGSMRLDGSVIMSVNEVKDAAKSHYEAHAVNSGSGETWRAANAKRFDEWDAKAKELGWK